MNYNSLKVLADLEKENNLMHIVARICFGKAAFDILDINAVQMTFINPLWLWKCSYFNQH